MLLLLCCCCQLLPLEQFACQWAPIRLWQSARTIAGQRAEPSVSPLALPCTFIRIFPYVSVLLVHCKTAGQSYRRTEGRQFVVVTLHLPRATCATRCESRQGEVDCAWRVLNSFYHKNVNHKALMPRPTVAGGSRQLLLNLITQVAGEGA